MLVLNIVSAQLFQSGLEIMIQWIKVNFGWLFGIGSLAMVGICTYVYFSPLGNIKIGGEAAVPLLNTWNWFAISLCTTVAAGILFWSAAEPIYHLVQPPEFLGLEPESYVASTFSMSTMFMHWTITPYAIYCVPALIFAFAYYNMKKPYSFTSCLIPVLGERGVKKSASVIDSVCLFVTAAGMASSLGTGILSVAGGISQTTGMKSSPILWTLVGVAIITTFIVSSTSGLMKGIKLLSNINTKIFIILLLFVLFAGPTAFICNLGTESVLYAVLAHLPCSRIIIPVMIITVFLSFVTAADSTTNAMASLCMGSTSEDKLEPPAIIKIVLGILLGAVAIIMITGRGIEGIKMLATLGGFPATCIIILSGVSLIMVAHAPDRFINHNKKKG